MSTQYADAIGAVQQFGKDKPIVTTGDANGQQVSRITIKVAGGTLLGVTLGPEYAHVVPHINRGALVAVNGSYSENVSNGTTYRSIFANSLAIVPAVERKEREVVNQQSTAEPVAAGGSPLSF